MRECAWCKEECDSQIGMARELQTQFWGGKRTGLVYSPKVVTFFCNEDHRNSFIAAGASGGEVQTERWQTDGDS